MLLDFDHDLYCADQIPRRRQRAPPRREAGRNTRHPRHPGAGRRAARDPLRSARGRSDRAALEAVSWEVDYEAREHGRGVVTGGIGTLGTSAGRWSRKLKCEVFFATWEPAVHVFVGRHVAPGVDEMLRWLPGYTEGAVAGVTEPAGVLRAAGIPAAALGMDEMEAADLGAKKK